MKKIGTLLLLVMAVCAQSVWAEAFKTPDPSKTYVIQHSSGLLLTRDGNAAKIMSPGTGDIQKFTFVPVEGKEATYNIMLSDGSYFGSDGSYTVKFLDDPADEKTQYTFWDASEPDHVKMWNIGRGGYIGTDNNNDGGGVYTDKSGTDGKHAWKFIEYSDGLIMSALTSVIDYAKASMAAYTDAVAFPQSAQTVYSAAIAAGEAALTATTQDEINTATRTLKAFVDAADRLYTTIVNANTRLANAVIGDATGNYPQSAADALQEAINTAVTAWPDNTPEGYNAASAALTSAVAALDAARYVFVPNAGSKYYFVNTYSNLLLTMNSNNVVALGNPEATDNQKFEIIPVEGKNTAFLLKRADGAGYAAIKSGWDTQTVTEPTADAEIWFGVVDLDTQVYTLNRANYGGAWAPDTNSDGNLVYTNKSQSHTFGQWKVVEAVDGVLLTMALENNIAAAEDYLAKAVVGEEPGMYPQEAVDALKAAIATAKAVNATTQAEVNEASRTLAAAINTFLAARIDPFFVPEPNTKYRFSVNKYIANYMTASEGDAKVGTSTFASGNKAQQWTFQPVEDAKYTYIVKNEGKVLNYDGTLTETADAEAPKWTAVYTGTYNNLATFALVEYDAPTNVMTFGSGKNFAIQTLSATNNAHQGYLLRVDAEHDPNVYELDKAVANAYAKLDGVKVGNEIGEWSQSKCDKFKALIDGIKAARGLTQEEVDAKVAELNTAASDFLKNPNSVIKDELEAALAAGNAKAASAEIGVEVGQFTQTMIEEFKEKMADFATRAAAATDQEEVDALAQEVNDAVAAFTGHETEADAAVVLADLVTWCEKLYEAEKDNVGNEFGQRPQTALDAYAAAIAAAKANTAPTADDINTLLAARDTFKAATVKENRANIRKAIAAAEAEEFTNLVAGDFHGNYPQEAIDSFNTALTEAKTAVEDYTKTQDELDAATKKLNDAMTALRAAKVSVSFTDLDQAIANAKTAVAGVTEIGDEAGKCPQSIVDALQQELTAAEGIDRTAINQADVDAETQKLNDAVATFLTDMRATTGISEEIMTAKALVENATEGFKPGNYPVSAITMLNEAIREALLVSLDNSSTQAQLLQAVADLKEAEESFKSQVVPSHDLTEINALIAKAEAFVAEHGNDDYVLALALSDAKAIVADADNHTKSEIDKAASDLKKALDYAEFMLGVNGVEAGELTVVVNGNEVAVKGISGRTVIMVATMDGRIVANVEAEADVETLTLNSGAYVLTVQTEGKRVAHKLVIK